MMRPGERRRRVRERLRHLSLRDAFAIGLPALALLVAAFWFTAQFIRPAPPDHLVISTGGEGGAYEMYAARYRPILARNGIELRVQPSAGALENLQRLQDSASGIDVAFLQGGLAWGDTTEELVSLGSFYIEPLWVFYRGERRLDRLTQLKGQRIAIGAVGSGTRVLALELLEANGVHAGNSRLRPYGGMDAIAALQSGTVDAVFAVGPVHSSAVWAALYTPEIRLMNFAQANAYTRRFPYLSHVVLPRGAVDLQRDVPARDVHLVATTATVVARESTHPALIDLLLQAAAEVHGPPNLFQRPGEFPNAQHVDFPLSKEADRYYKSGTGFLQRYLPFWAATLIDRLIVLLIPIIAILLPLMRVLPMLYKWRVRARIYKWYGELKFLEDEIEHSEDDAAREEWLFQLDRLDERVNHIRTPLAYANQLYILREHIGLVRSRVLRGTTAESTVVADEA